MVERLGAVVNRDAQRSRLAGKVAADHQHHAEFAQRVGERQDGGGQHARPGQRQLDAQEPLEWREPAHPAASLHVRRHRFEAALNRLNDEGHVDDHGGHQQALEGEDQPMTDRPLEYPADQRASRRMTDSK